MPPPPVVFVGVLFVVVGCDDVVVGGWVTGAGAEFVVGAGAAFVVTAAPPLLELPSLELLEPLELPALELLALVAVVIVFFLAGLCCFFFLFGSAFFVVAVVGVVAAAFVVLELEAAPPQPAIASASAITLMGRVLRIRRIPPRDGIDGPGYTGLVL